MTEAMEENILRVESYGYGFDKGTENKEIEVIKNMVKDNLNINKISKYCNVPVKRVKEIINNIQNNKEQEN